MVLLSYEFTQTEAWMNHGQTKLKIVSWWYRNSSNDLSSTSTKKITLLTHSTSNSNQQCYSLAIITISHIHLFLQLPIHSSPHALFISTLQYSTSNHFPHPTVSLPTPSTPTPSPADLKFPSPIPILIPSFPSSNSPPFSLPSSYPSTLPWLQFGRRNYILQSVTELLRWVCCCWWLVFWLVRWLGEGNGEKRCWTVGFLCRRWNFCRELRNWRRIWRVMRRLLGFCLGSLRNWGLGFVLPGRVWRNL